MSALDGSGRFITTQTQSTTGRGGSIKIQKRVGAFHWGAERTGAFHWGAERTGAFHLGAERTGAFLPFHEDASTGRGIALGF